MSLFSKSVKERLKQSKIYLLGKNGFKSIDETEYYPGFRLIIKESEFFGKSPKGIRIAYSVLKQSVDKRKYNELKNENENSIIISFLKGTPKDDSQSLVIFAKPVIPKKTDLAEPRGTGPLSVYLQFELKKEDYDELIKKKADELLKESLKVFKEKFKTEEFKTDKGNKYPANKLIEVYFPERDESKVKKADIIKKKETKDKKNNKKQSFRSKQHGTL